MFIRIYVVSVALIIVAVLYELAYVFLVPVMYAYHRHQTYLESLLCDVTTEPVEFFWHCASTIILGILTKAESLSVNIQRQESTQVFWSSDISFKDEMNKRKIRAGQDKAGLYFC